MSEKPPPKKDKTIHISHSTHDVAKKVTREHGLNFGAFCDKAILKEAINLNSNNSQFSLISTQFLIDNGWEKAGSSHYRRKGNIIQYSGTDWFLDGELLTEQNYLEKIK